MEALLSAIDALDRALTGKAHPNMRSDFSEPEDLIDTEIYLSDGGYSRVVFSMDTGRLFLTSNSRDEVREAWDGAKVERDAVAALLQEVIDAA